MLSPPGTHFTAESTEAMRIKCLAQGNNILLLGFEPSTSVSKTDILANRPICYRLSTHDIGAELIMHSFTVNCDNFSNEEKVAVVVPVTSVVVTCSEAMLALSFSTLLLKHNPLQSLTKQTLTTLSHCSLVQVINKPTHMWGDIIDWVVVRPDDDIHRKSTVTDSLESVHYCTKSYLNVLVSKPSTL